MWSGKIRLRICFYVAALAIVFGQTSTQAQDNNRQELFQNLLRALIESRMEDTQQTQQYYGPPVDENRNRSNRDLGRLVNSFNQDSLRLFDLLAAESRVNPGLRSFLNPTLEIQAQAAVLENHLNQGSEWAILRTEFTTLDREWRLLSHRLQTVVGLNNSIRTSIQSLDNLDRQLGQMFDVTPQVDSREFLRLTDALQSDLQNLFEDISIELGRTQQARQLLVQGRLIAQQVRFMADAIEYRDSRDSAVDEFTKFQELWGPFAAQLWPLNNRYLDRSLQRIEQHQRELHEVLWLETPIDQRQLTRLVDSLNTDVNELYETITLKHLLELNNRELILAAASEFHQANEAFRQTIAANRPLPQLQNDFRVIEQKWDRLYEQFSTYNEPEILRVIKGTERTMLAIQDSLSLNSAFDREQAMQILASLENLGEHLQEAFSSEVLPNPRYNRRFSIQGLHTSQQFTAFTRNIHFDLADGVDPDELRGRSDTLVRGWNYLNDQYIDQLQGAERERMTRLASQITPLMVQLQTMFDL